MNWIDSGHFRGDLGETIDVCSFWYNHIETCGDRSATSGVWARGRAAHLTQAFCGCGLHSERVGAFTND